MWNLNVCTFPVTRMLTYLTRIWASPGYNNYAQYATSGHATAKPLQLRAVGFRSKFQWNCDQTSQESLDWNLLQVMIAWLVQMRWQKSAVVRWVDSNLHPSRRSVKLWWFYSVPCTWLRSWQFHGTCRKMTGTIMSAAVSFFHSIGMWIACIYFEALRSKQKGVVVSSSFALLDHALIVCFHTNTVGTQQKIMLCFQSKNIHVWFWLILKTYPSGSGWNMVEMVLSTWPRFMWFMFFDPHENLDLCVLTDLLLTFIDCCMIEDNELICTISKNNLLFPPIIFRFHYWLQHTWEHSYVPFANAAVSVYGSALGKLFGAISSVVLWTKGCWLHHHKPAKM